MRRAWRPPPRDVPAASPADVASLRADLEEARFTAPALEELLGPVAAAALRREQAVPALRALGPSPAAAATLARCFVLGRPVSRRTLDAALPRLGAAGAVRCQLALAAGEADDDEVRAVVDLAPVRFDQEDGALDRWFASDVSELASGWALRADHVLGVGGASTTLLGLTVRDPVGRVLDVGTGGGVQAIVAAPHAGAVVGTDTSVRALAFARLNAALAGVDVDLREGSMLEPVAGEAFDLVVSNPPFVITPAAARERAAEYTYRDGGRGGDDLVRDLVTGVGAVLAPGGVAQLLGSWEHRAGEGWQDRVSGWLAASGLDGWVVQREVADPAEYAETWLRDGGLTPEREPEVWRGAYEAWLDDFEARGVVGVGFGYVTLRRPMGRTPSLRRVEELTGPVALPLGPHVRAVLRAEDWLARTDDAALGAVRLVVAPDVTEERYLPPGQVHPSVVLLRQGGGLGRAVRAGTALAGFVGACDGELEVRQVVGGIAALLDVPAAELGAELLPQVRGLVRDGLLAPA